MPESELERLIDAILYSTGQRMDPETRRRFTRFLARRVARTPSVCIDNVSFS